jgi:hypothetical protein
MESKIEKILFWAITIIFGLLIIFEIWYGHLHCLSTCGG